MNVAPLTVEQIIRSNRRDRPMLVGYLLESLILTAQRLWPDFTPQPERKPLKAEAAIKPPEPARAPYQRTDAKGRFLPVWRRRRDGGQALSEYAVILALVVIVAVIALVFIGGQVSTALQDIGASI